MHHIGVDPGSTDISVIGQNPVLWMCAAGVFLVIIVQSAIYLGAIRKGASEADLTRSQVNQAVRSGAVAAIGPSLAVSLVAISLLPLFATPAVLTRIGLVGSAAFDVAAAGIAAGTQGAELGGASYTQAVFVISFGAMTIAGLVWMVTTLILTPILAKGDARLRSVNPAVMAIVPSAAILGAFCTLAFQETLKSPLHIVAMATAAVVMIACLLIAKATGAGWLREWGLGIAIAVSLGVVALVN